MVQAPFQPQGAVSMKRPIPTLGLCLAVVFMIVSCTPAAKTYIFVESPDIVGYSGKPKFKIGPGDVLEVTHTKPCISGDGICWEVRDMKTGEWGFVNAEAMKRRHHVYEETKKID